ncbi:MAG TPA: hypothetical protein VF918_23775 [Anaerolineales bacterium]
MKSPFLMVLLLIIAFVVSGCANNSKATAPAVTTEPLAMEDKASLISALEASGATVETGEPVSQAFFSPEGSIIKVNGADVQVFEYESVDAMESEASQVAPDGGSIGTTMVSWMDTPHFYKTGRIIVLYVGSDKVVLDLLGKALGPQFAGR